MSTVDQHDTTTQTNEPLSSHDTLNVIVVSSNSFINLFDNINKIIVLINNRAKLNRFFYR